jgi:Rrf2 family transcriptional regulator, cysteine metabolism repressor
MWITRQTDYATRAVLALALAGDRAPLKLRDLADRTSVPPAFLEQIMPQLRLAGVVRSERGPSGGYRLNHDPADITLEHVVRVFQGQLAPIACATRSAPEPCPMEVACSLKEVWTEVRDATIAILERVSFADLARRAGGRWVDPSLPPPPDAVPVGGPAARH